MCGIAGILTANAALARPALLRMTKALAHRGPDDEGLDFTTFHGLTLGLANRRLAIIDRSQAGHQPMHHPGRGDQLVYNGELYNFRELRQVLGEQGCAFNGESDTEVVLHHLAIHGSGGLTAFAGMFALAYFDASQKKLLLARDPNGIKPLYYYRTSDTLLFASEVRALLASGLLPPRLSRQALASYLAYGSCIEPEFLIAGVQTIPAGHYQWFGSEAMAAPTRYWHIPAPVSRRDDRNIAAEIRARLTHAVKRHLVSDVPVGILLSAGVDSTIIATLARQESDQLTAFTIGFDDPSAGNEITAAAATAKALTMRHVPLLLRRDGIVDIVDAWVRSIDMPSIDGLNVYIVSKLVSQQGVSVALSGLGGDELFGGYSSFKLVPRVQQLKKMPWLARRGTSFLLRCSSQVVQQKWQDFMACPNSLLDLFLVRRRLLSASQMQSLGFAAADGERYLSQRSLQGLELRVDDPVWSLSQFESLFYQTNVVLRDADQNSMAFGLELRLPFLDVALTEFVHSIPGSKRLPRGAEAKFLLKKIFAEHLRPELQRKKKQGFTLPMADWMRTSLRSWCEDRLAGFKARHAVDARGIDAVWRDFLAEPHSAMWARAWALCVLGDFIMRHDLK